MTAMPTDASALLGLYQRGSTMLLSTPCYTLLAQGERARLPEQGGAGQWKKLAERVGRLLLEQAREYGAARTLVVGALPFDERLPARLVVPQTIGWSGPLDALQSANASSTPRARPLSGSTPCSVPSDSAYVAAVEQALRQIEDGTLRKVVLARSLEVRLDAQPDVAILLRQLLRHNQGAYTFGLEVGQADASRTLLGASPELVVSRRGRTVLANPLAGSARRCATPEQDQAAGWALLRSAKDRREHAFVAEAVANALRPLCTDLCVPTGPALMRTATMWHLSTQIRGHLRDSTTSSLQLATALHPTPAICGTPTLQAQEAIRTLEGFERGYYAGLIGWSDAGGDGEWVLAIRCAQVDGNCMRLFAGAGIIEGSQAQAELNETTAKFRTVLNAMGVAP